MGYGNWIEERQIDFPADVVYESLLGVLAESGYKIDKWDASVRGVIASGIIWWSFVASGPIRIAASIAPKGEQAAVVTIESGPAYDAHMFGATRHRKNVEQILSSLNAALGST